MPFLQLFFFKVLFFAQFYISLKIKLSNNLTGLLQKHKFWFQDCENLPYMNQKQRWIYLTFSMTHWLKKFIHEMNLVQTFPCPNFKNCYNVPLKTLTTTVTIKNWKKTINCEIFLHHWFLVVGPNVASGVQTI